MFLRSSISTGLNVYNVFKILVCYYHTTVSLFSIKVKISSLLIHKTNHRYDTLDLTQ